VRESARILHAGIDHAKFDCHRLVISGGFDMFPQTAEIEVLAHLEARR
jgi:hypothetical protein